MKQNEMKQSEVKTLEDLSRFLRFRSDGFEGTLYHYTNIGTLIKILRTGQLLINNAKNVNDALEAEDASAGPRYVASFTYEETEAVHYWAVYGRGDPYSVRLAFDCNVLTKNPLLFVTDKQNPVGMEEQRLSDVIYYSKKPSEGRQWKHNLHYFSLREGIDTVKRQFSGFCKYNIWEHEKETRLLVKSTTECPHLFLALPYAFFESLSVVFSPWIDRDVREELSKPIIALLRDKYRVDKTLKDMMESSIHNQIRLK